MGVTTVAMADNQRYPVLPDNYIPAFRWEGGSPGALPVHCNNMPIGPDLCNLAVNYNIHVIRRGLYTRRLHNPAALS